MKKYTKKQVNEMLHRVFLLTMLESRAHPGLWTSGQTVEIETNIINYVWTTQNN